MKQKYLLDTNQNEDKTIPADLQGYLVEKSLGGGTKSTYLLYHPENESHLVLKYGVHPDALKMEFLVNVLYRVLGVRTPEVRIFSMIPQEIAEELKINQHEIVQVATFIKTGFTEKLEECLFEMASRHFVAHALLGNIDIAKEDNFIIDQHGQINLIDAGANFIYRALGEPRSEPVSLLTELDSLRNSAINPKATAWFKSVKDSDIKAQIIDILKKLPEIEHVAWEISSQINMSDTLREKVLTAIGDRLDVLIHRYRIVEQIGAKLDKKSVRGQTAAGILTYTKLHGQWHILLSKRVGHEWWDNFGGKSEDNDFLLINTARREVLEESKGVLNYSQQDLDVAFHDLVSETAEGAFVYRMFLKEHEDFELHQLTDSEHTEHIWVPLRALISALDDETSIVMENQKTLKVVFTNDSYIGLYPPLFRMLKQPAVLKNLKQLEKTGTLSKCHTRGYDVMETQPEYLFTRVFSTPNSRRTALVNVSLAHGDILKDIKSYVSDVADSALSLNNKKKRSPSQSELHLQIVLGHQYQADNLYGNVRQALDTISSSDIPDEEVKERVITQLVEMIETEQYPADKCLYIYHSCDNKVAFIYEIYTLLYETLNASNNHPTFRAQSYLYEKMQNITTFIEHYSEGGNKTINDHDEEYIKRALSANLFLFGCLDNNGENTIYYFLNNKAVQPVNLQGLLQDLLLPFNISSDLIQRLIDLYEKIAFKQKGALYQIGIDKEVAATLTYPAEAYGIPKPYKEEHFNLATIIDMIGSEASSNLSKEIKEYVRHVQARAIVHPGQQFTVKKMRMFALDEIEQNLFDNELKKIIKAISYSILQELGAHNRNHLHPGLTLFRTIKNLSKLNSLPNKEDKSLVRLADAILGNDDPMVIHLLMRYPEWKSRHLTKQSYLKNELQIDEHETLKFIVLYSKLKEETLTLCFGTDWWSTISINDTKDLLLTVSKISSSSRVAFITLHQEKIKSIGEVNLVLACLTELERLDFAILHQDKIKDGSQLSNTLACLPEEKRFDFAIEHQHKINNGSQLGAVLKYIPELKRVDFAHSHQDKIVSAYNLRDILEQLPLNSRYTFLIPRQDKITNGAHLSIILGTLPYEYRLNFLRMHQVKIKTAYDLSSLLEHLDEHDCFNLATSFQHLIKNGGDLAKVIEKLPKIKRLSFCRLHENKIGYSYNYRSELKSILGNLMKEDRFSFAMKHRSTIKDGYALCNILEVVPIQERLIFANKNHCVIRGGGELSRVLDSLPQTERLEFAKENRDCIGKSSLLYVLSSMPDADRLTFALLCKDMIKESQLEEISKLIPKIDRALFLALMDDTNLTCNRAMKLFNA